MRQCVALVSWGTLCMWMKKQVLVPCMSPIPRKSRPILFDMTFLHLSFSGTLMMSRYSFAFPVLGQMTSLDLSYCNVSLLVTCSMTAQSSPAGHTREMLDFYVCRMGCCLLPHGFPWGLVLGEVLPLCYTGDVLVSCGFLLTFFLLRGALIWCNLV